jgi:hypothetical protein
MVATVNDFLTVGFIRALENPKSIKVRIDSGYQLPGDPGSLYFAGSIKGDVKKKHSSLNRRERELFGIQPLGCG